MPHNTPARRAGRPSTETTNRNLVLLLSKLQPGITYSIDSVSSALDITPKQAEHLLQLLIETSSDWRLCVPLDISPDAQTLTLRGNMSYGKPIKLRPAAWRALKDALTRAGLTENDPLSYKVQTAFGPLQTRTDPTPAANSTATQDSVLDFCLAALLDKLPLTFTYQGTNDTEPHTRHVRPIKLTPNTSMGTWYLEAYDLERAAERTFNLMRIHNPKIDAASDTSDATSTADTPTANKGRLVEIIIDSAEVANSVQWNEELRETWADGRVRLAVRYYRGMWLPARLAAVAPHAQCTDAVLMHLARTWASNLRDAMTSDLYAPAKT